MSIPYRGENCFGKIALLLLLLFLSHFWSREEWWSSRGQSKGEEYSPHTYSTLRKHSPGIFLRAWQFAMQRKSSTPKRVNCCPEWVMVPIKWKMGKEISINVFRLRTKWIDRDLNKHARLKKAERCAKGLFYRHWRGKTVRHKGWGKPILIGKWAGYLFRLEWGVKYLLNSAVWMRSTGMNRSLR